MSDRPTRKPAQNMDLWKGRLVAAVGLAFVVAVVVWSKLTPGRPQMPWLLVAAVAAIGLLRVSRFYLDRARENGHRGWFQRLSPGRQKVLTFVIVIAVVILIEAASRFGWF